MQKKRCAYLLQTDRAYAAHAMVTMLSVHRRTEARCRNIFYVIDGGIGAALRVFMERVAKRFGYELYFLSCDEALVRLAESGVPTWRGGYTAYLKLFALGRLPEEWVLYLDADVIAVGDVSAVFAECAALKTPIAMAEDMTVSPNEDYCRYLFGRDAEIYYNCGVILCNIPRWRQERCEEKILSFVKKGGRPLLYWEQDVLNLALRGRITSLSCRYNFCTPTLYFGAPMMGRLFGWTEERAAFYEAMAGDYVLGHCFAVFDRRPWDGGGHPLTKIYEAYYREIFGRAPEKNGHRSVSATLQYALYRACPPLYVRLHNLFMRQYYRHFIRKARRRY